MQCRDFREIADSYLSDELLIETNHDVIRHLEKCAGCRRELSARRELHATLRASFAHAADLQMTDEFARRLRAQLRATHLRQANASFVLGKRSTWLALAACLLIVGAFGLRAIKQRLCEQASPAQIANTGHQLNSNGPGAAAAASPITGGTQAVKIVLDELAENAVGDHRDCAVNHRLPERPIDLEEAGRKYDHSYLDLTKAVMSQPEEFQGQIEFVAAHSCVFEGRRFAHVILKYQGRLVSVLVTDLGHPRATSESEAQSTTDNQEVVACSQLKGYQVSCFGTAQHAVFVISDLPEAQNLVVARALAPAVYQHIERAENAV